MITATHLDKTLCPMCYRLPRPCTHFPDTLH